jgi:predicted transcriptional regulator
MEAGMTTLTISVSDRAAVRSRALAALNGTPQGSHISFANADLAWTVITSKRMAILRSMVGAGPMSYREIARRIGRDVKAVHTDARALLEAGILRKEDGGVVFPFDAVHFDFMLLPAP